MDQQRENYAETGWRMNWRPVRLVIGLLFILFLAAIVIEQATLPHQLTQEEADRIQPGMTPEEVEAVLGRPPDHSHPEVAEWKGHASFIDVVYRDGRVERVVCRTDGGPRFSAGGSNHLGIGY